MKKSICIILSAVLLFAAVFTVNAADIFYQNALPPSVSSVETSISGENTVYNVSFTSSLSDAEILRTATEDAVAEMLGGKEALGKSEYSYLSSRTMNYLQLSTDKNKWITVSSSDKTKGTFSIRLREDIAEKLLSEGISARTIAKGEEFYFRVLTASENHTDKKAKDIFVYTFSDIHPVVAAPFGLIEYVLPSGAENPSGNIRYFSLPLKEDITLLSPVRKGYIFDGWSLDGEKRTGKIPAGTEYACITSHWTPMKYEINYILTTDLSYSFGKADMTNMPTEYTVGEGAVISDIKSPVYGYTFDGWYYKKDFSGERVTEISPDETGVKLLYAKWLKTVTDEKTKEEQRQEFIKNNKFGDIDDDGKISASDARLVLRAVVGLEDISAEILKRADYRGTGKIMADNARTTLRLAVGLDDLYKILLENGVLP